jgi:hypothetical protein
MNNKPMFDRVAADLGLPRSRLITASKSGYHERHPDNVVVFNATIADAMGTRLWWGDVDVSVDEGKLVDLAAQVGVDLYLYFEGDSRDGFVKAIDSANAVVAISDEGLVTLGTRVRLVRDVTGRIVLDRRDALSSRSGPAAP